MATRGEEIRRRLAEFAARWGGFGGTERSEAQTFLNDPARIFARLRLAKIPHQGDSCCHGR